jgi:propanol-preferring alcohol dehydrogenase
MKAWNFTGTHQPLVQATKPEPAPGAGMVKIAVKAAGLCHSDVGILEDEKWIDIILNLPVTPGHEIADLVESVGPGVTDYGPGDRVCVWPIYDFPGYRTDGGFGEKVIVSKESLIRIPDEVPFEWAAVATDAGMTSHIAVMGRGAMRRGEKLGVIGVGGLGQIGARIVVLNRRELYVAEINEAAWPIASRQAQNVSSATLRN